jgi:23S rRNA (cytosine1962-C5)-methyltransferase
MVSSKLSEKPVRYIVDDAIKFVEREIRRGNTYDAIIMDPPSFGRGANGEVWHLEDNLFNLVELCAKVLSDKPLFFLINSYTTGLSPIVLENILNMTVNAIHNGQISSGEVGLPMQNSNLVLPCGIYGRWENEEV